MVLQYRPKSGGRWKKYSGKDKIEGSVNNYNFRLLNETKTKILADKGSYAQVMKRFRQIEFFKHRR
jgi:hypothetical protein